MIKQKEVKIEGINRTSASGILNKYTSDFIHAEIGATFDYEDYKNLLTDTFKGVKNVKIVYEVEEEILTDREKSYLRQVIAPFRGDIKFIRKNVDIDTALSYIEIDMKKGDYAILPNFENETGYYAGMEAGKLYTIKELGL